jgi:hypothetical protein
VLHAYNSKFCILCDGHFIAVHTPTTINLFNNKQHADKYTISARMYYLQASAAVNTACQVVSQVLYIAI